jgi:hypothetical protein
VVCDEDQIDYLVDFYSKSNRLSISIFTVIVIDIVAEPYKQHSLSPRHCQHLHPQMMMSVICSCRNKK